MYKYNLVEYHYKALVLNTTYIKKRKYKALVLDTIYQNKIKHQFYKPKILMFGD